MKNLIKFKLKNGKGKCYRNFGNAVKFLINNINIIENVNDDILARVLKVKDEK